MTNIDLIQFDFVDRKKESKEINRILTKGNTFFSIPVIGCKGAGKNCFVDKVIKEHKDKKFVIINFKEINEGTGFLTLLNELEKQTKNEFSSFLKKNYTKITNLASDSFQGMDFGKSFLISKLFILMLNASMLFSSIKGEQETSINVIKKYLKKLSNKYDFVLVLKNISYCDEVSLKSILTLLTSLYLEKTSMQCIVTIDRDSWDNDEQNIRSYFTMKISSCPICISAFNNYQLFYEMMFNIFKFKREDIPSIQQVFLACNGCPGKLKEIIGKFYMYNAKKLINIDSKVPWDSQTIEKILTKETCPSLENPYDEIILQILVSLRVPLPYFLLLNMAKYACNSPVLFILQDMNTISEFEIKKSISRLAKVYNLLSFFKHDNIDWLKFSDDILRELFYEKYKNENILPQISNMLCKFFEEHKQEVLHAIGTENYELSYANQMFIAKSCGWEEINFKAGQSVYQSNQLILAQNFFLKIKDYWSRLNSKDAFIVSKCFFDTGKYNYSYDVIKNLNPNEFTFEEAMHLVKIKSINMQKKEAVALLDNMLSNPKFAKNKFYILDIKQRILSNIRDQRNCAKKIFDDLMQDFEKGNENIPCEFLISAMEYYRGEKVQKCFDYLENYYKSTDNQMMLAELEVNRGFDLFWQGKIEEAKKCFAKSLPVLKATKPHELSYALNNYANCLMMKGEFEAAVQVLQKAIIFNESLYASIVLKTHLMICYVILEQPKFKELYYEIKQYIISQEKESLDISIYLKVYYNLGVVQEIEKIEENSTEEINFIQKAIQTANQYPNDTLPYIWFQNWKEDVETDIKHRINIEKYYPFFSYRFEPWLLTITHD